MRQTLLDKQFDFFITFARQAYVPGLPRFKDHFYPSIICSGFIFSLSFLHLKLIQLLRLAFHLQQFLF